jgi:type IV pilus assembly protein PilC
LFFLIFIEGQNRELLRLDKLLLKLPVFGTLARKAAVAKFARTFGTLIKSGVPIMDALETVAKTSGNLGG